MLERHRNDAAAPVGVLHVSVVVVEAGERAGRAGLELMRQRPERAAHHERLLIVRPRASVVVLAVVEAGVDVAVVALASCSGTTRRRPTTTGSPRAPRRPSPGTGSGKSPSSKSTHGVCCMPSRTHEPRGHPVVQVELRVGVLQAERVAAVQRAAGAGLARDVGRDAERDDVRDVAGDVDVRPADVEGVRRDLVAVGVRDLGLLGDGVVGEDRRADAYRRRVVGRGVAGRRGDLRRAGESERGADRGQAREPGETNCQCNLLEDDSCWGSG